MSLAIDEFRMHQDDFNQWVELFETAVKLAYAGQQQADIDQACIDWLPLKLDDEARSIRHSIDLQTWDQIKTELKTRLVNPDEQFSWLYRQTTIIWDQKESLHSLASRITKAVDKYDKDNPNKAREYFIRFRGALPVEYQKAINVHCSYDQPAKQTISEAKTIALRIQMAEQAAGASGGGTSAVRTVAFTGASMTDDRLKTVERSMEGMKVRMDGFDEKLDRIMEKLDDQGRPSRDHYSQDMQSDSRERSERSYDFRDRRDLRDRRDSRDHRDSRNCDSPDRRNSPDRDGWNGRNRDQYDRNRRNYDERRHDGEDRRSDRYVSHDRLGGRGEEYRSSGPYGAAILPSEVDFICNALAKKRLRDQTDRSRPARR